GSTLYNDNRPEHLVDNTNFYWPVEAGYWGFNRSLPDGVTGSVVLIKTNSCGVIIGRETITFPENSPQNFASSASGATATASTTLDSSTLPAKAIDGNKVPNGWWNSIALTPSAGVINEHLDIALNTTRSLQRVILYFVPDDYSTRTTPPVSTQDATLYGIVDFRVQVRTGSGAWSTVATVTGNTREQRAITFPAVSCDQVRIQCDKIHSSDTYARIVEVEAFAI
ncbi:discoidin domain-containing protein, partial [Spirosoma litoris]